MVGFLCKFFLELSEDPVWTLRTGSFFLIRSSAEKFFQTNFLTFDVMLSNQMNVNETLGSVDIAKSELLKSTGERALYELVPAFRKKDADYDESRNGFGGILDRLPHLTLSMARELATKVRIYSCTIPNKQKSKSSCMRRKCSRVVPLTSLLFLVIFGPESSTCNERRCPVYDPLSKGSGKQ